MRFTAANAPGARVSSPAASHVVPTALRTFLCANREHIAAGEDTRAPSHHHRLISSSALSASLGCFILFLGFVSAAPLFAADQKISPSDLQFFESKIRPIFVENCYKCHSQGAEKIK